MKYKYSFTLIELLIVISITVLLAALLMSVLIRAKAKAQQNECFSNLKQLGMAALMYGQDYDNYLPPYVNEWPGIECMSHRDGRTGWCEPLMLHEALNPYIKNKAIWFCPSDPYAGTNTDKWGITHIYSSYGFNFKRYPWLMVSGMLWTGHTPLQNEPQYIQKFYSPSGYSLISDPHFTDFSNGDNIIPPSSGGNHFGGINVFYLDGHIKWIYFHSKR